MDAFDSYFGLAEDLEQTFGRKVDLVMLTAVTNPYFKSHALADAESVVMWCLQNSALEPLVVRGGQIPHDPEARDDSGVDRGRRLPSIRHGIPRPGGHGHGRSVGCHQGPNRITVETPLLRGQEAVKIIVDGLNGVGESAPQWAIGNLLIGFMRQRVSNGWKEAPRRHRSLVDEAEVEQAGGRLC